MGPGWGWVQAGGGSRLGVVMAGGGSRLGWVKAGVGQGWGGSRLEGWKADG